VAYFEGNGDRAQIQERLERLLQGEPTRISASRQIIEYDPKFPFQQEAQALLYTREDLEGRLENLKRFRFQEGQVI